jgi:hypothetical protein
MPLKCTSFCRRLKVTVRQAVLTPTFWYFLDGAPLYVTAIPGYDPEEPTTGFLIREKVRNMVNKQLFSAVAVAAVALLCAPGAFATSIGPSGVATPPSDFTGASFLTTGTLVADTSPTVTAAGNLNGVINVGVYREAGGTMDFLYQFDPTSSFMQTLSAINFMASLGTIDVGYVTTNMFGGVFTAPTTGNVCGETTGTSSCAPINASWSPNTVTYSFVGDEVMSANGPGNTTKSSVNQNSDILVIRTNSTVYSFTGQTNVIDGGIVFGSSYQPTPEPGQVGMVLGSLFFVGLFLARRFQVRQN